MFIALLLGMLVSLSSGYAHDDFTTIHEVNHVYQEISHQEIN